MSTNVRLSFFCGMFAATSASLALYLFFQSRQEPSSRGVSNTSSTSDTDLLTRSTAEQHFPIPMPPVAMPPVYMIAPPMMPMQPYPTPPPPPPPDYPPPVDAKFCPSIVRVNDLQLLVHERQNMFTDQWEEFSPRELPMENLAFVMRSRIQRTPWVPSKLVLLEIRSDALKRVLKECDCLRYVESVFDPMPEALLRLFKR